MRKQHQHTTLFGRWNIVTALMASAEKPLPAPVRARMLDILRSALQEIAKGAQPGRDGWRDLSDMTNWLQSCFELGWVEDNDHAIAGGKAALLEAHAAHQKHGKLRMSAQGMADMRNLIEQFEQLLELKSERAYWSAIKHAETRIKKIWDGKRRPTDVVVTL